MTGKALMNAKCIEAAIKGLPSLPTVITRILEETEREDVSITEVERLLSSDQELVSTILKIVNSSYYGLPGQVRTISQAIVILGLRQVRNLVLGVHAMTAILPKDHRNPGHLQLLWNESLATAIGSRIIGKQKSIGEVEAEHVYVGGLLRRIGKLFLFAYFEDKLIECNALVEKWNLSELAAEEQILGLNHYEIGGLLAENWRLPEVLTSFIAFIEVPEGAPDEISYRVIDAATVTCTVKADGEFIAIDPENPAVQWTNFTDSEWDWIRREITVRVESMAQYVGASAA